MRSILRPAPGWRLLVLLVPLLLALAALGAAWLFLPSRASIDAPAAAADAAAATDAEAGAVPAALPTPGLLVDVSGAVAAPGLYRMQRGDRVYAAIAAAGGLTAGADPTKLPNLAGALRDGMQVRVPSVKGGAAGVTRVAALDLNAATADELAAVPGFTPALAQAVIDYRTNFGGFQSTRELMTEVGMGVAEFALAKRYVRV
jgi:competence protein ComEA